MGAPGVVLKVRGDAAEAVRLFRGLPGIESAGAEADEIRLEWSGDRDLREEVAGLAVSKGLGLLEMRPTALNMEELYMKIVSGGLGQ